MDFYLGMIIPWAVNYEPIGFMFCRGQLLQISQNQALFALLGTTYGGDGQTTFALPNLQGRVPVCAGQLQGGGNYTLGTVGGVENVALTVSQMPTHNHPIPASDTVGNTGTPSGSACSAKAQDANRNPINIYTNANANTSLNASLSSGSSQAHTNMQPYVTLNYIICVEGIFPSRRD